MVTGLSVVRLTYSASPRWCHLEPTRGANGGARGQPYQALGQGLPPSLDPDMAVMHNAPGIRGRSGSLDRAPGQVVTAIWLPETPGTESTQVFPGAGVGEGVLTDFPSRSFQPNSHRTGGFGRGSPCSR